MNAALIIEKKRDGGELNSAEIGLLIEGYVKGDIPDYQMAAWAMAVFIRGMTVSETAALTEHMLYSGVTLSWPEDGPLKVDKHSTGGIGDKVSLVLAPLMACCDLHVPMISGRGLGATGGTLDKLESIPGFRTDLSVAEMQQVAEKVGCVITGATPDLVPADQRLYGLRDVTATVPSIPLITASIMSKKLAQGLHALVLDVKYGSGAFMKSLDDARALAESLVATGQRMGVATTALVTDMNQPLGRMVGNAVEVNESIAALRDEGPPDLREITVALGGELITLAKVEPTFESGKRRISDLLSSGQGLAKFQEMVAAQGGDLQAQRHVSPAHVIESPVAGYVNSMEAEQLGHTIIELGGGRKKIGDTLDHSTGLEILVQLGEKIEVGQPLARVFASNRAASAATASVLSAIEIRHAPVEPHPLLIEYVNTPTLS